MDEAIVFCYKNYDGTIRMKKNIKNDLTVDFKGRTVLCPDMKDLVDSWNTKIKNLQKPKDPDSNFRPLHPIVIALTIKRILKVGRELISSNETTDLLDEARGSYLLALESYFTDNYAGLLIQYERAKKAIDNKHLVSESLANYVRGSDTEIEISEDANRTFNMRIIDPAKLYELGLHIKEEKKWSTVTSTCE